MTDAVVQGELTVGSPFQGSGVAIFTRKEKRLRAHFAEDIYKIVWQESIPAQIRQRIFHYYSYTLGSLLS